MRETMIAMASIAPQERRGRFQRERTVVETELRLAKQDPSLRDEATAFARMLGEMDRLVREPG
jgi:hypothetical protein